MAYVVFEDIIGYIDNTADAIQGDSQLYTIKLYKDNIGFNLNASAYSSFTINLYDAGTNLIAQYASPRVLGVSSELTKINTDPDTDAVFQFELSRFTTLNLTPGKIYANIVVVNENVSPTKVQSLPLLEIGTIIFNENKHDPSIPQTSSQTGDLLSNGMEPQFHIQHINGAQPIGQGYMSLDSGSPGLVSKMTFMNSDYRGIRISVLENFLINRIDRDGIEGTITLVNRNDTAQYSIFNVIDWYRINCSSGNCVDDIDDAVQVVVAHESSSEGPGVYKNNWLVGDEIGFKLDVYGSALSASDLNRKSSTSQDKELIPIPTNGNVSRTGCFLSSTPEDNQYIDVEINGISLSLGNGTKNLAGYFSPDGGTTSRNFNDLRIGDELILNAIVAGYDINEEDRVSFFYETYV
tara:strand:+ start:8861 stop:10084 length:1224 start_codon:yes stop_codon:yes gene_type:complete